MGKKNALLLMIFLGGGFVLALLLSFLMPYIKFYFK